MGVSRVKVENRSKTNLASRASSFALTLSVCGCSFNCSRKYPYSPKDVFFGLNPHPAGHSSLGSYFPLKIPAFKTSLLLGISSDPLWWGYEYSLEPHNLILSDTELHTLTLS